MKRRNLDPFQYSFSHVQDRAEERYGLGITEEDYEDLNSQVREACVADAINEEGDQLTFVLRLAGRKVVAVYSLERDLVTTLLPPEQFAQYLRN